MAKDVGFDFLAKSDAEPWRIEIKIGALNSSQIKHFQYKSREYVANGKVWLIVFGNIKTHSYTNRILRDSPILISSQEDIIKLEKILNIN